MSEFRMPSLGADMEAGTLVEWLKQPGDRVARGETIAAVETQKGVVEIECFETGVLETTLVELGQRVPVGTVLATIRAEHADVAASAPPGPAAASDNRDEPLPMIARVSAPSAAAATLPGKPRVSPAARRRAQRLGLDVASVAPGADGVIGLREVAAASPPPTFAPPIPATRKPGLDPLEMRKAIAAAMSHSWRDIPHYFVESVFDLEPLLVWLARDNAQKSLPDRLHYAAPLIKAVALALKATPVLNGHYGEAGFVPAEQVHLGIAIALRGGGLVVPALHDADTFSLGELMARLNDLVARVRSGRLRSAEMAGATVTLTNLGDDTADRIQPLIFPPQVAMIGCGRIVERAWAQDQALSARRSIAICVGGDHRVSDGRSAAGFLAHLGHLLQAPERL